MTSQLYGPYAATLGTIIPIGIGQDTASIQVLNDTEYDVLVSFANTAPSNKVNSLDGSWQFGALRHTNPVIPVQTPGTGPYEKAINAIGGSFTGRLWLCPTQNSQAKLALGGFSSTLSNIWVLTFAEGDAIPDSSSVSRQVDITNQPRVVAVPVAPFLSTAGGFTNSLGSTYQNAGGILGSIVLGAYTGFALNINIYVYSVSAALEPQAAAQIFQAMNIAFGTIDNTNTLFGNISSPIWATFMSAVGTTAYTSLTPSFPLVASLTVPTTGNPLPARVVPVILSSTFSAGGPLPALWSLAWDYSVTSNVGPGGPFGGQAGTTPPFAGSVY